MTAGDTGPFTALFDDDIEWWDTGSSQPLRGKDRVEARVNQFNEYHTTVELHDLFANDEHLVALIHATARRHDSRLDYSSAEIYHLSAAGLITKRQAFAHNTIEIEAFFA